MVQETLAPLGERARVRGKSSKSHQTRHLETSLVDCVMMRLKSSASCGRTFAIDD